MAFEFIQIPANGQGSAKEELNKLLGGWADCFCEEGIRSEWRELVLGLAMVTGKVDSRAAMGTIPVSARHGHNSIGIPSGRPPMRTAAATEWENRDFKPPG